METNCRIRERERERVCERGRRNRGNGGWDWGVRVYKNDPNAWNSPSIKLI